MIFQYKPGCIPLEAFASKKIIKDSVRVYTWCSRYKQIQAKYFKLTLSVKSYLIRLLTDVIIFSNVTLCQEISKSYREGTKIRAYTFNVLTHNWHCDDYVKVYKALHVSYKIFTKVYNHKL